MKILLVEDNQEHRNILKTCLKSYSDKLTIYEVDGANPAKLLLLGTKIDVVFCDYDMPNGNGGELFKFITDLKIEVRFVLSSSFAPEDLPEFDKKRIDSLQKPFGMKDLTICMKTLGIAP